jgi:predicted N-acetyltransferase YhbS
VSIKQVDALTEEQVRHLHALYQNEWWSKGRDLDSVREMLERTDLVIAFVDDTLDRLIAFSRILTDFVYHAVLYDVIVASDWRGRGLGTRLLDAVIHHPRLRRVPAMWLCCEPQMANFYARFGFESCSQELMWVRRSSGPLLPTPAPDPET